MTIGLVTLLVVAGCTSGGEGGAKPKESTIEAFESTSTDPGTFSCGATGAQKVRIYRSRDGSFAWLDSDADGTVDGIASDGAVYLRDPADTPGPTPSRWIKVPAGVADPVSYFAYFLNPWTRSVGIFDTADDPLHEFQTRQENGQKSPAPIFEGDPRGGTARWKTDDDGRVVEGTLEMPPEADNTVQSIRLLPPTEVPERPDVPLDALDLADEPLADYLPRSVMIDPECGETTKAALAAAQPCLDAAMAGQTVGEWVKTHDKQGSIQLPVECARAS
jgi:hypothetical protein